MNEKKLASALDWSRLLGFDQIAAGRGENGATKLAAKVGDKTSASTAPTAGGYRLTDPRMAKIGGKFGVKPDV